MKLIKRIVKEKDFKLTCLALTVLVGFTLVSFTCANWLRTNMFTNQVKSALSDIATTMNTAKTKTGGYPATMTKEHFNYYRSVTITGGSNYSGTWYCFAAKSVFDDYIVFHIDSTVDHAEVFSGGCSAPENSSLVLTPGGLATAYANSDEIKMIWNNVLVASGYKLQCATDQEFSRPKTVSVSDSFGACNDLLHKTKYYFRVSAVVNGVDSAWSSVVAADTK